MLERLAGLEVPGDPPEALAEVQYQIRYKWYM